LIVYVDRILSINRHGSMLLRILLCEGQGFLDCVRVKESFSSMHQPER